MLIISVSLSLSPHIGVSLYWVVLETSRCCHCRGLAAYATASSSTSCCTRWVSTTNTLGPTATSMSASTGITSINVRTSQRHLQSNDSDLFHQSVSYSLIFCHQILSTTSKRRTLIISTLRMTTPLWCTTGGKLEEKCLIYSKSKFLPFLTWSFLSLPSPNL